MPKRLSLTVPTLVMIANAFVCSNPPYLECIDERAIYRPTEAFKKLSIDDSWAYKTKKITFEVVNVATENGIAEVCEIVILIINNYFFVT